MADKIIVSATDQGGNSVQRTFDNVNPYATNAQLATFGSKIAALSENTYAKTDRVIRTNCDTTPGGGKLTPNFSLSATSGNISSSSPTFSSVVTYDGDGTICFGNFTANGAPIGEKTLLCGYRSHDDDKFVRIAFAGAYSSGTYTVDVFFTETATYKATAPVTITITVS